MSQIEALSALRPLIVGLGREGAALAVYLAAHGFSVTATDLKTAKQLDLSLTTLEEAGVQLVLGEHPDSLLEETDILFVSPGVPLDSPFLQAARARRLPLSCESRLFCHLCPAPIVGITGSSGKTTTTTLTGEILKATGRRTWVGGNIGRPLISQVDQMGPDDIVVMELSSFQLEYFHARLNKAVDLESLGDEAARLLDSWSPPLSAILNITPNHMDRHPNMKQYVRAKRAIIDYQPPDGVIIMNLDNDMTRTIGRQFGDRTRWFSLEAQAPGGASVIKNQVVLVDPDGTRQPVIQQAEIKLLGRHNLANILAACLIARELDVPVETMQPVIADFRGVEHRLELVRQHHGVWYYNDSIATSPERLAAALQSFQAPLILLAGGRDKHLPWEEAARLAVRRCRHAILFGEATELIAGSINKVRNEVTGGASFSLHRCVNLSEAVQLAATLAHPGDVVLLSPGCASFDAFRDFAERGERFKQLVHALETEES